MATQRELVEQLFEAALGLKPEERAAFLDSKCDGNAELRQQIESLLAEASFSERPTKDVSGARQESSTTAIGPYHLLELIGEGGMGEVWLAEQKQPVRRRVAIKLIKAGMDTREVVARFESERQALALMDHPAIAKVFDAGSTPEGRPYFVMEYAHGIPITTYCDKHKLTIRQRMELFIQVCEGVQHAHQKAIIHRDLKPSNVLVTEIDGKPMPRIIDFGVAKATSQKLSAETMYTRVGALIGTIGYMSPEQADPVREDVDIRTDVYSLGAMLYELLTGTQPLDFKKLAFDEILRILREQDALRPSTKITTLGGDSTIAAKNRGSDPPTLVRQLRGDPDAIALKALEKDRARRYAAASDLAADIGCYLRNKPVTAHPPSIAYRARKYIRRHRLGLAVSISAALGIALLVTWSRTPSAVPVVESVTQLTDDGQRKRSMVSDGSRIYFNEGQLGNLRIAQVSVQGGATAPVETPFVDSYVAGIKPDGSALLTLVPDKNDFFTGPLWLIPLPAGEPRRIGSFETQNADIFSDGRIVFSQIVQGKGSGGTESPSVDWLVAEKDGSNARKLISLPGDVGNVWVAPDGQRILLSEEHDGVSRFLEIAADGTDIREIRKLSREECCLNWTPDEKYLVYQSGNAQQSDIWALPFKTWLFGGHGKPIRLTNGPIPYSYPYPSRDGKQIFVFGTKQRGEFIRYDLKSHQFLPFLIGISATHLTFSRDGKWVAYASYPDRTLWRSRTDGSERMPLTYPPMDVRVPSISPDGTKISFHTNEGELYVIGMDGGTPRKVSDSGIYANWSPDGNYLFSINASPPYQLQIIDLRNEKKSVIPSYQGMNGSWVDQDTLVTVNQERTKFVTFNLKTQKWSDLGPRNVGNILNWSISPDGTYLYFMTFGAEPKAERIRFSNQQIETLTSLKDLHLVVNYDGTQIGVAPDGSPIFTRDTGYQEIYALNIRWP